MATVRRLYIYLVCLISLQSVVGAVIGLFGGLVSWAVRAEALDTFALTFQLAVIIVGAPIFLGHWLWAAFLARKDPVELNSLARRVYLYLTQGVMVAIMAGAVFGAISSFVSLVLPALSDSTLPAAALVAGLINSAISFGLAGALWFYHHHLSASAALEQTGASRALHQLYLLLYSAAALLAGASGLAILQMWVFHRLAGDGTFSLPIAAGLLGAGGLVWLYHEWARAHTARLRDAATDGLRWLYATLFGGTAVLVALGALYGVQTWLFHWLAGDPGPPVPDALAVLTTSLLVLVYYEWAARPVTTPGLRPWRWLYATGFSALGMFAALGGLVAGLQWFFALVARQNPGVPDAAAWLLGGLLVWAYHQRDMTRSGQALGLDEAEPASFRGAGRLVRRWYVLTFSAAGVGLAAQGLIGVQEWLFTRLGGQGVFQLPDALAWLITGVLAWLYYWRWAGQLFASRLPDERQSDLRKAYLYLIISVAVITAIVTIALLVNGTLRALLGLPTSGGLALSLAIIIAAAALWAYHAFVLRGDIAAAGESALQAGMQRLYWYVVAALGLAAFVIGLGGELSVALRLLALGFHADEVLKEQLAGFTAAFVAGLPVWLLAWFPAQRTAARPGPAGAASRRSILRKVYLYFYLLAAVVITLSSAIRVVYQLLNALFGLFGGGNVLADIAQSIGFTVISSGVWLYHGWVLRGDGQRAKQDRPPEPEPGAEAPAPARGPVAVVDGGDGAFGRLAITALKRYLPNLTVVPVGLTAEAGAAMGADPAAEVEAQLAPVELIIIPWTALAAGAVAQSSALKIVVPMNAPGLQWAAVSPNANLELEIARAVTQALNRPREAARPAPPAAEPQAP